MTGFDHSSSDPWSQVLAGLRLLIIDDDAVDRETVRRALTRAGSRAAITALESLEQAQSALVDGAFDCAIVDYYLAGSDGRDVVEACRKVGTPVIVLTGHGDEELAVQLMKLGASDYLVKGTASPERLMQAIRGAVRVAAAERNERQARNELALHAALLVRLADASLRVHEAASAEQITQIAAEEALHLAESTSASCELPAQPLAREGVRHTTGDADQRELPPLADAQRRGGTLQVPWSETHPASLRVVLSSGGREFGSLWVTRSGRNYGPREQALLQQLAQTVSVALRNAELLHETREVAQARDDMMAIVSHDLRNPLNTVTLGASMLRASTRQRPDSADDLAIIARIERGLGRMGKLIEDLLDASRIDAGRLAVSPQIVRGESLIMEALEAGAALAQAKNITIEQRIDSSIDVLADRHRVLQLFSNLVGNAVKFTPPGGSITLSLEESRQSGLFCVTDTGPGISPQHRGSLFNRFWKASEGSRDGAGLGLYIARGIAQAHGGAIGVDSELGRGTRIWFTIPRA